jgi:ElaB/YqjD/DUF883 family membrane-anchored ribosome-binding protein
MEVAMENYATRSNGQSMDNAKDGLVSSLKTLITDADTLMKATMNYSAEGVTAALSKLEHGFHETKSRLANAQSAVADKTGEAMQVTESYVQAHPWKALAAAVAVGAIAALLVSRASK